MSGQTRRWLVVGESGSGKTELVGDLIDQHRRAGAFHYLVAVSSDPAKQSALARHCKQSAVVDDQLVEAELDLAAAIEAAGSLYLEVEATDPKAVARFLDRLGAAIKQLGSDDESGSVLLVVDEAAELTNKALRQFLALWSAGRKRGITIICISQSMKQRPDFGINPQIVNRSDVLVAFHLADDLEVDQVARRAPAARHLLPTLRTPLDGGPPEYLVADTKRGQTVAYRREGRQAA